METHRDQFEKIKHLIIDRTGYVPDDMPWSDLYLVRKLQESRAMVLKNQLRTGQTISEQSVQTFPCVDLTEVDRNECPCAPASGCYWLKTDQVIPREIKIISVTGIVANGDNPRFDYMKWDRFQYIPKARYESTSKGLYYSIRTTTDKDTRIYLYGNRFLQNIAISGIFEDPMLAAAFPKCGEKQIEPFCNPLDVHFYADVDLISQIIDITLQKIVPPRSGVPTDPRNDDTTDPLTVTK
jgi:hypothetical protein